MLLHELVYFLKETYYAVLLYIGSHKRYYK